VTVPGRSWTASRRRRDNLKDPSQSGYDLALADFGIEAGLSEQQIVDLIIHHRRLHRLKPRNRIDYYQRTIARAERRTWGRAAPSATTGRAYDGDFIARELAEVQSVERLVAFGERLAELHDRYLRGTQRCECRRAEGTT
jgi:hypothetical protein